MQNFLIVSFHNPFRIILYVCKGISLKQSGLKTALPQNQNFEFLYIFFVERVKTYFLRMIWCFTKKHEKLIFFKDYYVIDGASILPVLSLGLEPGDRVLDMCAAPGGKSVAILQTQLPSLLVANDMNSARSKRIKEFFQDILLDTELLKKTYFVTKQDACGINEKEFYNKVYSGRFLSWKFCCFKKNIQTIFLNRY